MLKIVDIPIHSEDVISSLKKRVCIKDVCRQVIYQRIIQEASTAFGIQVDAEEVQTESERFRHENRLQSAQSTMAWLEDQLITADDWEEGIAQQIFSKKLSYHLFNDEAEKYFIQNKLDFDRVNLYRIVTSSKPVAYELLYQIEEEEISFYEAAQLYDINEDNRLVCGFQGKISRWQLSPQVAAHVFGSVPGRPTEPIELEDCYAIFMVRNFIPAEYDATVQQHIIKKLFSEWLEREYERQIHSY
ncbi:peptidylprolyl isomerase [filamentous cyanobacterium CCP5]|nr:peptidylprolyl isomerase [filamentous cyanobacterium CCP5]